MKLKDALLVICLSLVGCSELPPFPEIGQCAYKPHLGYFVCGDTTTKEILHRGLLDPVMEGAQCLSAEDFKKSQAWVSAVEAEAQRRCK